MHISKHHYARALAKKGNKVFFLNPPKLGSPLIKIVEKEENIFVTDYCPIFRGRKYLPRRLFNQLVRIQAYLLQLKIGRIDILWSFSTSYFVNLRWFKADYYIFHPVDQINSRKIVKSIGASADIILSCSDYILNEAREIIKPKFLIPHGLSPSFVDFNFELDTDNTSPQVCYIGNLFIENLNRSLLKQLIQGYRNHTFHFIGAFKREDSNVSGWINEESLDFVEFLMNQPNVTCHGVVASESIPERIKKMDVFLVCYKQSVENRISNSHKILEYLSTGKAIISSPVEHYRDYKLIQMCEDDETFVKTYNHVLNNLAQYNAKENQIERRDFSLKHSYHSNLLIIEEKLSALKMS